MLILFDHGAPRGVSRALRGHTVITAKARGWDRLSNGVLLKVAEESAVDLLFTTDQRIRYQQNLTGRKIAIVLAGTTKWSRVRLHLERIAAAVDAATPGSYTEVDIPFEQHARGMFTGTDAYRRETMKVRFQPRMNCNVFANTWGCHSAAHASGRLPKKNIPMYRLK